MKGGRLKESQGKNNVIRKTRKEQKGKQETWFRPDSASRGGFNAPHAVQVVLVWSRVARGQNATRRLIPDGASTLRWKTENKQNKLAQAHQRGQS